MQSLRLGHVDSCGMYSLEDLTPKTKVVQAFLLSAFRFWRSSYLSVATYLTVVATVAVYDMILTIRYWNSLKQLEENPIGRWLLNLDHIQDGTVPNLALFLSLKALGTVIVLMTIAFLVTRSSRLGHPVATGVSCFQLGLATYLTFAENS